MLPYVLIESYLGCFIFSFPRIVKMQYETAEQAEAVRNAIYGVKWPPHNTSKPLTADFVLPKELDDLLAKPGSTRVASDNDRYLGVNLLPSQ